MMESAIWLLRARAMAPERDSIVTAAATSAAQNFSRFR